jgi:hypothetical protein
MDSEPSGTLIYRGRLTDKFGDVHKDAVCVINQDGPAFGKVNQILLNATDEKSPMLLHGKDIDLHYCFGNVSNQVLKHWRAEATTKSA